MSTIQTPTFAARDRDGLAITGMTKHQMMGIRYVEGEGGGQGGEDGQDGNGDGQSQTPPAAPQTPPAPKPAPPAAPQQAQQPQTKMYPQEYVTEVREEAKGYRVDLQAARQENETLKQERDQAKAELEASRRESAIVRHAQTAGANHELLLDSEKFKTAFAEVNLADEKAVTAAIKEFVEQNPAYSATRVPGSSGGAFHGGNQPPNTPKTLGGAVTAALTGQK